MRLGALASGASRVRAATAMSNDPATRRLLPQSAQMGSFSFAPQQQAYQAQPRETQKNYVFVDEHNRHKRLKGESAPTRPAGRRGFAANRGRQL